MTTAKPMKWIAVSLASIALAAGGIALGFWLGRQQPEAGASGVEAEAGREVLYWYDPMVPDQHFDKPGKSPFMDMDLVPRYADESPDAASVRIDPGVAQNLGIRLAAVERGPIQGHVRASGVLAFNERELAVIQAKAPGFVEGARGRAVGDVVRTGDPLVDLRIPEWTSALAEYLALRGGDSEVASAARQRLAMLAVPEASIREAEEKGRPQSVFTIRAPIAGAITELAVRDGMNIAEGEAIATINHLSPIWVIASAPQGVAGRLQPGARAMASLPAYPGETFEGRVESVLPQANIASRTVEVRVALPNLDARLRPGMTADVNLSGSEREALLVPAEAVIRTGRRAVVIVASAGGRYTPADVEIGAISDDRIEIVSGLSAGQRIVSSGQFLIDSEASLSGILARLQSGGVSTAPVYSSAGRVTAVDDTGVTIAHEPVSELNWPSMTMVFGWGSSERRAGVAVGDDVEFTFREGGAGYVLESIEREGTRR